MYVTMLRLFQCCRRLENGSVQKYTSPKTLPQPKIGEKPGYIYIIQEREFIKTKEPIYKIGKTVNMKYRMPAYPKNSCLYLCFYCTTNINIVETYFIDVFDQQFINRSDIGREYYEGDLWKMIRIVTEYISQQQYN